MVDWCTPPGSPLEAILKTFEAKTNLPLELPFFSFMFYLGGYLQHQGALIDFGGADRGPQSWTIVLAPSGCGKTFSASIVGDAAESVLGLTADFPSCDSGAALFDSLLEFSNAGKAKMWLWEELAQKLKLIEQPGSALAPAKEILLKCYDGKRISRKTMKSGEQIVENPSINILGLNTDDSFFRSISGESLCDGFAQRFSYVVAERDANRSARDYPIYDQAALKAACEGAFREIAQITTHPQYVCGADAEAKFRAEFRKLFTESIPESFFRRVMFLGVKYALYFHIILGKHSDALDAEDMGWALRVCSLHLNDAAKMLAGATSDLARLFEAGMRVYDKCEEKGKPFTPRELVAGVSGIKTVAEARGLHQLVIDAKSTAKPAAANSPMEGLAA